MDEIAKQIGAKTRKEFQHEMNGKAWIKAYAFIQKNRSIFRSSRKSRYRFNSACTR
jgi:hypothetical protein